MTPAKLAMRLGLVALLLAAIVWAALNRDRLDLAALDAWLVALGFWAPVAHVGLFAAGTVAFLPGALFALAGGALFGPVWGSLLNLAGATLGASVAFLVTRYVAGDWVTQRSAGRLKGWIAGVEAEGWRFVAFIRLVPLFPFNLTNYALGLTRIGFLPYIAATLVCMAPGGIAYSWLGHAGREAAAGHASAVRWGLLALALLAAIAFLPRLIKRLRATDGVGWIAPQRLHESLLEDRAPLVLDVRSAEEFVGPLGHIRGALNVPLDHIDTWIDEFRSHRDDGIAVACRTEKHSAKAAEILRAAGFSHVAVLQGGMERWTREGLPVERRAA